ncbi:glutathione peroxidase [Paenibacillus gansuensis]|uniref:Glutathione peroxidase n=1 Tax=Paenibacillus gansuensis TaxID=306542 RepID=A0ABW5PG41_9BACL
MSIYTYEATTIKGEKVSLEQFKGKVVIVANTASKCGFTPQYEGLQKLYDKYKDQGLVILGFPSNQFGEQEPGSNEEVSEFCQLNYGVTFPMFEKTDVRGETKEPLFAYLVQKAPFKGFDVSDPNGQKMQSFLSEKLPHILEGDDIKWNFTKFLIGRDGESVQRFESNVNPADMETAIEALL